MISYLIAFSQKNIGFDEKLILIFVIIFEKNIQQIINYNFWVIFQIIQNYFLTFKLDIFFNQIFVFINNLKYNLKMKSGTSLQVKGFDIWSLAKDLQRKDQEITTSQKTLIVVGDHNAGKTSFVKVLKADSDTEVKPTCALEYTFIRKSAIRKQLVHCYEIAGKNLRGIISSLITKDNYRNLYFAIVVDLGLPNEVVDKTTSWIQIIRQQTDKFLQTKIDPRQHNEFYNQVLGKYANHEDKDKIQPLPFNTILIGNKYDIYEKHETEVRKWISRVLRYMAHTNGCHLFYNSIRTSQLSAQIRIIFQSIFFGQNASTYATLSQKDHLKPIMIMSSYDNLTSMSLPHSGNLNMSEALKKHISGLVPTKQQKKVQDFDFSKFNQSRIDSLVAQKQKQLQKISKEFKSIRDQQSLESPSKRK